MRKLLILFSVLSLSCNTTGKKENEAIGGYFSTMTATMADFKMEHNRLMDSCTNVINDILSDRLTCIDTNGLRLLVTNAKAAGKSDFEMIKDLKEVDTAIGLNDKFIDYLVTAGDFYDNYYDKFISLTVTPRANDSLAVLHLVGKEIKLLAKKGDVCTGAYRDFKAKYNIQVLK